MTRTMLALLVLCVPALARDNGQYNSVAPEVRQWFRAQKSPKTGGLCCNEADGTYAEEDIRNGVYWTRFESTNLRPLWAALSSRIENRISILGARRRESCFARSSALITRSRARAAHHVVVPPLSGSPGAPIHPGWSGEARQVRGSYRNLSPRKRGGYGP
jgi:hypothetical protein